MIRRCLWASCWSSNSVLNLLKLLWKPCMFVRDRFSLSQWYNWLIKAEARIVCYIAQSTFLETHIGWLQSRSTDPLWRKTERINCIFCKNLGKDLPKKKNIYTFWFQDTVHTNTMIVCHYRKWTNWTWDYRMKTRSQMKRLSI